ncbi:MAG: hypothetical protein IKY38_04540, partial [Anaerotignum sp.]|nr:hypothetical protein [Anaerotignum sp.]
MELKVSFDDPIYGLFFYNGVLLVHSGTKLYKVVNGNKTVLFSGAKAAVSDSFIYENIWYFKDGKNYLRYDGATISEVVGYVPTTSIARKPAGGGTIYDDVNMLSSRRINSFLADGESKEYVLDDLLNRLTSSGYSRCGMVEGPGQFAVRGGILDIFSPAADMPVRAEFFGDELDTMGYF